MIFKRSGGSIEYPDAHLAPRMFGDSIIIDSETDLDIVFENKPEYAASSKWVMVEADDDYPTPWVAVDGIQKYYKDKKLIEGWFGFSKMSSKTR